MRREQTPTMGFKEMIIKEHIMAVSGYPMSDLADARLVRELGIHEPQVRYLVLNISKTLCQDPVENPIFAHKIQTVGDVLFYFYAPAERYKYFEKIILDGKQNAGDFIQKSMHPTDKLADMLRDENETKAVFEEIQAVTGRNYWNGFQPKWERGEAQTIGDLIRFLSEPENGRLVRKVRARGTLLNSMVRLFERPERARGE